MPNLITFNASVQVKYPLFLVTLPLLQFLIITMLGLSSVWACDHAQFKIAIDIGHSLRQAGTTSARGTPEFVFNKNLAATILTTLHANGFVNSTLINDSGNISSLTARVRAAERLQANLFISIHHDAAQPRYLSTWTVNGVSRLYSEQFHGFSLFVSGKNRRFAASKRIATLIGTALLAQGMVPTMHHAEPIRGENRPLIDAKLGLYRYDNLRVIRLAPMPALLLEAGVIVNPAEELVVQSRDFQEKIATSISHAVSIFCANPTGE